MAANDQMASNPPHHAAPLATDLKRKRSPSHDMHLAPAPLPKTAKHNHLQINYLARHNEHDLPLITNDDTLPNILSLLTDYQGVLDRHESMACNLGARPLGPILIKRFERLFDGPPRVLKSHAKDGTTVSWLDVVEFARNKPEQFQLDQMSQGVRVCQFYTKQCRVQISEEDFVLISSGIPQKMIPPQPIMEDEEKELGTMDILEKNLSQICSLADQVAARTRQLNHRLKGRKQAILDRRASAAPTPQIARPTSPSNVALMNGTTSNVSTPGHTQSHGQPSHPSPSTSGFVAVNARPHHESNGHGHSHSHGHSRGHGSSSSTRHELLSKFHTVNDRRMLSQPASSSAQVRRPSVGSHTPSHPSPPSAMPSRALQKPTEGPPAQQQQQQQQPVTRPSHPLNESELHTMMNSPVPIPNTPSNLLPASSQRASQQPEKDDGGPFKVEMVQRMESLAKGERIVPPCDRCRRLHMDCLKNLTACMGCTKKHAKCSWKEVREGELRGGYTYPPGTASNGQSETSDHEVGDRASTASPSIMQSPSHHAMTPSHASHSNGQHTPQHQPSQHQNLDPSTQPLHQQDPPHDVRAPSSRTTPPERERDHEHERNVEAQLNEAAQTGLAHANPRMPGSDGKNTEYPNQAMVA